MYGRGRRTDVMALATVVMTEEEDDDTDDVQRDTEYERNDEVIDE